MLYKHTREWVVNYMYDQRTVNRINLKIKSFVCGGKNNR